MEKQNRSLVADSTQEKLRLLIGELPKGCPVCGQDLDSDGSCPNPGCEHRTEKE